MSYLTCSNYSAIFQHLAETLGRVELLERDLQMASRELKTCRGYEDEVRFAGLSLSQNLDRPPIMEIMLEW